MKNLNILKKLIKEELATLKEGHNEMENYMFFQNIKSISDATSQILQMNTQYVDSVLSDGHQWAVDHIATSADDVSEVVTFLKNRGCMQESENDFGGAIPNRSGYVGPPLGSSEPKKKRVLSSTDQMLQSIIDSVTDLAGDEFSMMGLSDQEKQELTKVDSILKRLVDRAAEGSSETGSVEEKKLTKAELRKREDVAKGIKKSNPKMPMDKKMAIATTVAKKVAEAKKGFTSKYDSK